MLITVLSCLLLFSVSNEIQYSITELSCCKHICRSVIVFYVNKADDDPFLSLTIIIWLLSMGLGTRLNPRGRDESKFPLHAVWYQRRWHRQIGRRESLDRCSTYCRLWKRWTPDRSNPTPMSSVGHLLCCHYYDQSSDSAARELKKSF